MNKKGLIRLVIINLLLALIMILAEIRDKRKTMESEEPVKKEQPAIKRRYWTFHSLKEEKGYDFKLTDKTNY